MLVAIGPGSQRAGPRRPAGGWQASTSGPGWRDSRRATSLSRAVSGPVGGAADVEGDRGARLGEEEPVDLVDGESGVLDLGGGVATQVAAREQCRPDAGLEQALDADEAGGVGADVFEEAQLPAGLE